MPALEQWKGTIVIPCRTCGCQPVLDSSTDDAGRPALFQLECGVCLEKTDWVNAPFVAVNNWNELMVDRDE